MFHRENVQHSTSVKITNYLCQGTTKLTCDLIVKFCFKSELLLENSIAIICFMWLILFIFHTNLFLMFVVTITKALLPHILALFFLWHFSRLIKFVSLAALRNVIERTMHVHSMYMVFILCNILQEWISGGDLVD